MKLHHLLLFPALLQAETGRDAWLRYAPLDAAPHLPAVVTITDGSPLIQSAQEELVRGIRGMTGKTLRVATGEPIEDAIVLRSRRTKLQPTAIRCEPQL